MRTMCLNSVLDIIQGRINIAAIAESIIELNIAIEKKQRTIETVELLHLVGS